MRQQLTVNLAAETGPVFHGASGALYGLSEDGVPGADLLAPLHVRTIGQKPPGGLQHPTGDAEKVAPGFISAGGEWIFVYLQDIYPDWPYKDEGIASYVTKVKSIVSYLADDPYYVLVPFNEPDWIWYDLKTADPVQYIINRDRFLADWTTAYLAIRSLNPDAFIAGPNEAYYDSRFMLDFLSYAKAGQVLPDIISWHELSPSSLRTYRSSYASFRALEQELGIPPRPVSVNEYGNRRDLSNPGQLVQWIAMFEDTKVHADQAYWDIAGNYADNAVHNTMPNGSWWLLRWYGAMTGQTVQVTPPAPDTIDTLGGLACLDREKRQARIILANPAGDAARVALTGIDPRVFGERVRVLVQSTTWTGYDGAASTPLDLAAAEYPVLDGQVAIDLDAMDPMTAYQLTMSPAAGAPTVSAVPAIRPPWIAQYLAAAAALTNCVVYQEGSATHPERYAAAGGADVGSIDQPDSRLEFEVTVPQAGRYLLSVYYGNQTEDIAEQIMRVDDQPWSFISYPPTLNWAFWSHQDRYLDLAIGCHTITFGVSDPAIGTAKGQVTLNAIRLASASTATPGVTHPAVHYPAAYADLSGGATVDYGRHFGGTSPAGYVTARAGSGVGFVVQTGHDGYYDLRLRYAALARLDRFRLVVSGSYLRESAITSSSGTTFDRVYLHAGINPIQYLPEGSALIESLDVTPDAAADAASAVTYAAAAPGNVLSGTAVMEYSQHAYGGQYVGRIGRGAANTLTFTGVSAPWAGSYRVVLSYASNDRAESGNYNANLIDPGFTVTTSAGSQLTAYARNTYSWHQFNTVMLTVRLAAGENTITFGNTLGGAPNIDKITVAPASLP